MHTKISRLLFYATLLTTFFFLISGYGFRWGFWELGTGFQILRYSAYAIFGLAILSLIGIIFVKKSGFKNTFMTGTALVISLILSVITLFWFNKMQNVPPIHDITTNIESPPEFVDIVRLRADAPNPPEYASDETAKLQQEYYPDLQTLILNEPKQEVIDEIVALLRYRDWDIVSINRQDGRIEATEKLPWFGFKDDVVLQVTETDKGTIVDMRSKSRVGRSDIGVNADRIRNFFRDLNN